jgi:hypothetical protein
VSASSIPRGDGRRFVVHSDEKLDALVELERQVLTVAFISNPMIPIRAGKRDSLPYGNWESGVFHRFGGEGRFSLITFWPVCKESWCRLHALVLRCIQNFRSVFGSTTLIA